MKRLKLALGLAVLLGVIALPQQADAAAKTYAGINNTIPYSVSKDFHHLDSVTRNILRTNPRECRGEPAPSDRAIVNCQPYHTNVWLSPAGRPAQQGVTLASQNAAIDLDVNSMVFLSSALVRNRVPSGGTANPSNIDWLSDIHASGNIEEGPPVIGSPATNEASRTAQSTQIWKLEVLSPTNDEGYVQVREGDRVFEITRPTDSRYWTTSNVAKIRYVNPNLRGNTPVTIRVYYQSVSQYGSVNRCTDGRLDNSGANVPSLSSYGLCDVKYIDLSITISAPNMQAKSVVSVLNEDGTARQSTDGGTLTVHVGDRIRWAHSIWNAGPVASGEGAASVSWGRNGNFQQANIWDFLADKPSKAFAPGASHQRNLPDSLYNNGRVPAGDLNKTRCQMLYYRVGNFTIDTSESQRPICIKVVPDTGAALTADPGLTSMTDVQAGDTLNVRGSIDVGGYPAGSGNASVSCRLTASTGAVATQTVTVNSDGQVSCGSLAIATTILQVGQEICVTAAITPQPAPVAGRAWTVGAAVQDCVDIYGKPYVVVHGGDVRVGGGVGATADSCEVNGSARITTNARQFSGSSDYVGAGVQYAASAPGFIDGFISGQHNGLNAQPTAGTAPKVLTFTNNTTESPIWGGGFEDGPACSGFVENLPRGTATETRATTTIAATNVSTRAARHIKGNVYISGNIAYVNALGGGYASIAAIPEYRLVVEGNIYVDASVNRLDGVYAAIANADGEGGEIYTCATAANTAGTTYEQCDTQLAVNGSFAAKKIHYLRACGSATPGLPNEVPAFIGENNALSCKPQNHAAESFSYSPLVWLPSLSQERRSGYDSITNMPPVF